MEHDKELEAINKVIAALNGLEDNVRTRVVKYVLERFGISAQGMSGGIVSPSLQSPLLKNPDISLNRPINSETVSDIRSLKEQKSPRSAIQMAVLVAYYLQETAPLTERKDFIDTNDVEKYFKQAGYRLPSGKNGAADTLNNAKNGGYLEVSGRGAYKLNPVGYNLIAYGLPKNASGHDKKKISKKKKGKKASKKK